MSGKQPWQRFGVGSQAAFVGRPCAPSGRHERRSDSSRAASARSAPAAGCAGPVRELRAERAAGGGCGRRRGRNSRSKFRQIRHDAVKVDLAQDEAVEMPRPEHAPRRPAGRPPGSWCPGCGSRWTWLVRRGTAPRCRPACRPGTGRGRRSPCRRDEGRDGCVRRRECARLMRRSPRFAATQNVLVMRPAAARANGQGRARSASRPAARDLSTNALVEGDGGQRILGDRHAIPGRSALRLEAQPRVAGVGGCLRRVGP